MPRSRSLLLSLLLAGGCAQDADFDGFYGEDDCDDTDPFTYPGAPDAPADGIDADCDGEDPDYAFVETWTLASFSANYSSFPFFVPDSESGGMEITREMTASISLDATLNPDLTGGVAYPITAELTGDASPVAGPHRVELYLDGEAFGESVAVDLGCGVVASDSGDDDVLECEGLMQALGAGLDAQAQFILP